MPLQAAALRAEFERCNGHKDCLDRLVFEFGGEWKKAHVSRQLKAMGLAKGKFTEAQVRGGGVPAKLQCSQAALLSLPGHEMHGLKRPCGAPACALTHTLSLLPRTRRTHGF